MWETTIYKKGKRRYGWWVFNKTTGIRIYVARRWHHEIFRSGEITISEAMRKNIACWALDNDTLQLSKIKGVAFIGVRERDTGSLYLTSIDNFYDPAHMSIKNYTARGGALQRFVPLENFRAIHKIKI